MKSPNEYYDQLNNIYDNVEKDCHDLVVNFGKKNEHDNSIELMIKCTDNDYHIIKDWERKTRKIAKVSVTIPYQVQGHLLAYDNKNELITYNKKDILNVYWAVFSQFQK